MHYHVLTFQSLLRGRRGLSVWREPPPVPQRARPVPFPTLCLRAARDAAGAPLLARCVARHGFSRLRTASIGTLCPLPLGMTASAPARCTRFTRARAALARCTRAARRGAADAPLRGAHSRVLLLFRRTLLLRTLHDACVCARRSARSARLCGTADPAETRGGSAARRRDVPRGEMRAASEADSRARRHSFRLSNDTRDVCSGAW